MENLEDLLNIIKINCKHQFGVHKIWFYSQAAYTALRNGKVEMAANVLQRLIDLVMVEKEVVDLTCTLNKFIHIMNDKIKVHKHLANVN